MKTNNKTAKEWLYSIKKGVVQELWQKNFLSSMAKDEEFETLASALNGSVDFMSSNKTEEYWIHLWERMNYNPAEFMPSIIEKCDDLSADLDKRITAMKFKKGDKVVVSDSDFQVNSTATFYSYDPVLKKPYLVLNDDEIESWEHCKKATEESSAVNEKPQWIGNVPEDAYIQTVIRQLNEVINRVNSKR